jgi:hypothetical protein
MINKIFKKGGCFLLAVVLPDDPYGHWSNELASFTPFEQSRKCINHIVTSFITRDPVQKTLV